MEKIIILKFIQFSPQTFPDAKDVMLFWNNFHFCITTLQAVFYDSCPTKSLDNYLITNCTYIPQDLPQHKSLPVNTLYHFCCSLSKRRTICYQLKLLIECLCIRPYYTCWGYWCSHLHCMLLHFLFFNSVTLGRFKDTVCMHTPKNAYILTSVSTEVWFMVK